MYGPEYFNLFGSNWNILRRKIGWIGKHLQCFQEPIGRFLESRKSTPRGTWKEMKVYIALYF